MSLTYWVTSQTSKRLYKANKYNMPNREAMERRKLSCFNIIELNKKINFSKSNIKFHYL